MWLVKDEGSSRRKEKEVIADDLPAKTMGEETSHSELERSEEDEEGCDLDNKRPLLIILWYDTHIHFPVVPGDYSPLPPGHVWLSICCRNMEVS